MMAGMQTLPELFRFDAWANARVFKVTRAAEGWLLDEEALGTVGTINSTLSHMVSVEEGFTALIAGATGRLGTDGFRFEVTTTGLSDEFFERGPAWYGE